jgi:hypothetical protein
VYRDRSAETACDGDALAADCCAKIVGMATFLLTWNPDGQGWPDAEHEAAVEAAAAGRALLERWSVALRKSGIHIGDRAFLVRQRRERGIVASGRFTSEIYACRLSAPRAQRGRSM